MPFLSLTLRSNGFAALLIAAAMAFPGSHQLTSAQSPPAAPAPATKPAEDTPYNRKQLSDLVYVSKKAERSHRGMGASNMAGVKDYLWQESPTHAVYIIERNDDVYGEYCSETVDNALRILERTEYYLLNWQTRGKPQDDAKDAKELPYTRKTERFHWEDGICTGSTVEWQRTWRSKTDWTIVKSTPPLTFNMVRSTITVTIPPELMTLPGAEYTVGLRRTPTKFERDFMHVDGDDKVGAVAVLNGDFLNRTGAAVKDGKATVQIEWSPDDPAIWVDLAESVRNPPMSQLAYGIKQKWSMGFTPLPQREQTVRFRPR
jgi:hypothetical protein